MGWDTFKMCNFSFSLFPSFLLALVSFHLSLFLSLSLSASRAEGTSEGSGWLSLLEADGRPKARRPRLHEACFEHARIMSRGMTMDDGCSVRARAWLCLSEHFVHRSHSFFSHLFDPARWLTRRVEALMALEPLTPGVQLQYEIANQRLMPGIHQTWAQRWRVQ